MASLQYNSQTPDNIRTLVEQTENLGEQQLLSKKSSRRSSLKAISNCFVEREKNTNHLTKSACDYDEVDFVSNQIHNIAEINEIHNAKQQSNKNKIMGSNVSSSKGLSGRRTQSSSEYKDNLYNFSCILSILFKETKKLCETTLISLFLFQQIKKSKFLKHKDSFGNFMS